MIKSFGLLILRISIGTMLIHHGYEKLADIENFADAFVRPIGLPFPIFSSYIAAYSEIYGSWLLIAGLLTRVGALAIIGTMLIHHGYEKLADIENFADAFVRPIGLPFPIFSSYIAAYSEIYGSWLLIAGLFTRLGALAIIGTIAVAIYHAIATAGFNTVSYTHLTLPTTSSV